MRREQREGGGGGGGEMEARERKSGGEKEREKGRQTLDKYVLLLGIDNLMTKRHILSVTISESTQCFM